VVGLFERNRWRTGSLRWRRKCEGSAITSAGHHGLTRYESANPAQTPFNSDPDIIVHKVKTETILVPERDVR